MGEPVLERVVRALKERDLRPRGANGKWTARCPAHDDRVVSLSVGVGADGRALLHCRAGCAVEEIVAALGLRAGDLFDRANGRSTFRPPRSPEAARAPQKAAEDGFKPPSDADLERWRAALTDSMLDRLQELRGWSPAAARKLGLGFDGERIVFLVRDVAGRLVGVSRYPPNPERRDGPKMRADPGSMRELFPGVESVDGDSVWVVEGEGDAVALVTLGLHGTAIPGANGWRPEWVSRFAGRRVVVVGDCDRQGRELAKQVAGDLAPHAADVRVIDLDPSRDDGFDIGDLLREAGEDRGELLRLLQRMAAEAKPVRAIPPDGASAVPAAQIMREQVEWIWDGRVPRGSLTLLAGVPKLGKSLLTCLLAADVSRAGGTAILATAEDALGAVVRPRLGAGSRRHRGRSRRHRCVSRVSLHRRLRHRRQPGRGVPSV